MAPTEDAAPGDEVESRAAIRERLASGDAVGALRRAAVAIRAARGSPEDTVALHLLAAQAARALGDVALEIQSLEAAEEAAAHAPAALGATRLQLGLALLRRGAFKEAQRALKDALPVLADDTDALARARAALVDARTAAAEAPTPKASLVSFVALAASKPTRARVQKILEKLQETDPDAPSDAVVVQFLDELVEATRADRGFVLFAEPDGLAVRVARDASGAEVLHPHAEVSYSIARTAAVEGRTLVALKPAEDPRFARSRSARRLGLKAVIAAPIRFRRETIGVVVLDRRTREGAFDASDELFATEFARGAGGLIFRARRHDAEIAAHAAMLEEYARAAEKVRRRFDAGDMIGAAPALVFLLQMLEKVAPTDARVLIRGESGTGKELVARTIHKNSARRRGRFVAINCAAVVDGVLENELFGHVKGAFTGADAAAPGILRAAHQGTLFLDEVGDASPRFQAAILRFLEQGEVRPVGGVSTHAVDTRVLAATHEDLEGLVASGRFRMDLLHRLNSVSLVVPRLAERTSDIPLLARAFALEATGGDAKRVQALVTRRVLDALEARAWPGNVRELKNTVTKLMATGKLHDEVGPRPKRAAPRSSPWRESTDHVPTLREVERRTIQAALVACEGNKMNAAKMLGISRRGLYYLLEDHGLADATVRRR